MTSSILKLLSLLVLYAEIELIKMSCRQFFECETYKTSEFNFQRELLKHGEGRRGMVFPSTAL